MAVAIEGAPSYGNSTAGTYTAETTGSDRLLVICVTCEDGGTPDITACTFGGVSATQAVTRRPGGTGGPYQGASIYYIKQASIPSGPQLAAATFDSDPQTTGPFFDFFTLSGVDQTTPVDDSASDSLDNSSGTTYPVGAVLDTNTNGGLSFAVSAIGGNATTHGTWGVWTERVDGVLGGNYSRAIATAANDGTSITANPTFSGAQTFAALAAAAFRPAGSGSVAPIVAYYQSMMQD